MENPSDLFLATSRGVNYRRRQCRDRRKKYGGDLRSLFASDFGIDAIDTFVLQNYCKWEHRRDRMEGLGYFGQISGLRRGSKGRTT